MDREKNNYQLLISELDSFIRKYYINKLIKGGLYSLGFLLLLFIGLNLLESQFYFHSGVRKILFFSFIVLSGIILSIYVIIPLLKYFRLGPVISHEQAASIIGDHFENVKDKLLNVLQLKKQAGNQTSKDLIEASIRQKSAEIRLVPFRSAIDLSGNRKYIKYALPPLLLLLVLLFAAPSLIKDSTHRIIHNNQEFEKKAPFQFVVVNEELSVVQYDDFLLNVAAEGSIIPDEVFVSIDDYVYRLNQISPNEFSFKFNNVQKNIDFKLFAGKISSGEYTLKALKKPVVVDLKVALDYPQYTARLDEQLENIGDLVIPLGTKVNWSITTANTETLDIKLPNSAKQGVDRKSNSLFEFGHRLINSGIYKLYFNNQEIPDPDSLQYSIHLVPDQYPTIDVELFKDSLSKTLHYFVGGATDDYGIVAINFNYQVKDQNGKDKGLFNVPIKLEKGKATQYSYTWDIAEVPLLPGDHISYYFEVFDNDAINGSKSSRTQTFSFNKPTLKEFEEKTENNKQKIKADLNKSLQEVKKLQDEIRKMREKLLQEKEVNWQNKKEFEKLLEKQKELEKLIKEAKEKFSENLENEKEFNQMDQELQEKQEKIKELFDEAMSEEMKDLMKQIEEMLQDLEKNDMLDMMQKFQFNNNEMEMNLDRMLELFKQLEVEQAVQQQIDKLEELAEKQEKLSEKTDNTDPVEKNQQENPEGNEKNQQEGKENDQKNDEKTEGKEESQDDQGSEPNGQEELKKEQEEIKEEFEDIQEKMDEIQEKNEELEYPKNLGDNEQESEEIQQDLEQIEQQLNQNKNKNASKQQKSAAQKMKDMAQKMQQQMQSGQMEQMTEDLAALRQLLENLITLSFEQEDLFLELNSVNVNTPKYVSLVQQQYKLNDDFSLIQDSLQALSKRVTQIESFVTEKVADVNENMEIGLDRLEERQKSQAADNQQRVMKNVNDLALMLSEAMEQMQMQMSSMMSGSQMCDSPGSSPGMQLPDKMKGASDKLGEQMQKMQQQLQEGQMNSEKFAKLAAKQAALRKMLREIQKEKQSQGKGSKELEGIINDLDKIETELVNKNLNNEMLKRQQKILTRLLEAENAERQRGEEEKRKSEVGEAKTRELPPSLQEYIKKREAEIDNFKFVSPDVKPYYKQLIEEYLKSLKTKTN